MHGSNRTNTSSSSSNRDNRKQLGGHIVCNHSCSSQPCTAYHPWLDQRPGATQERLVPDF
jgi:hypothetical protein